jgi:deoxyadenosine/deoxycytidine kinase
VLVAGAGKTTLAKALALRLQLPVYYEPVADNEYLEDFYQLVGRCTQEQVDFLTAESLPASLFVAEPMQSSS